MYEFWNGVALGGQKNYIDLKHPFYWSKKMSHSSREVAREGWKSCCELRNGFFGGGCCLGTQNKILLCPSLPCCCCGARRSSECVRLPAGADNWLERAHQRPREPLCSLRQAVSFVRSLAWSQREVGQTSTLLEPGTARYAPTITTTAHLFEAIFAPAESTCC